MAVTITRAQLAVELRLIANIAETIPPAKAAILDRALAAASALVMAHAPLAPDAMHDSAVARCAAYLFDADAASARGVQSPLQHSGAAAMLAKWRKHRLVGVEAVAGTATPAGATGIDTVAVQALIDAHAALPNAHHTPPTVPTVAPNGFTALTSGATAVGDHTVTGWRDHDWLIGLMLATSGQRYVIQVPTVTLADGETSELSIEQDAAIRLTPTAGGDVIAIVTSSVITGTGASDTIMWWGWNGTSATDTGSGTPGHDQTARDAAAAANAAAVAAQRSADDALEAIAALDDTYSTDAERTAAVATLQAAIDAIIDSGTGTGGTRVYVDTQEPTGGVYALDDVWIRDVARFQIYKWTGTVWAVTFTLAEIPDVLLLGPGVDLPAPTQADYAQNAVIAVDGQWFYVEQTGHLADTTHWDWADLNDGQIDLAGWRGIVAENPFSIPNPAALDWAYVANEQRWVRYSASTWQYQPAPINFNSRFRTQNAAQNGGLVTVGRYIFDHNKHAMRIIRAYDGAVPGAPTFAWHAFQGEALDLERWAFKNESIQVQPRKLATFTTPQLTQIQNGGEQHFRLTARVHKNADGSLTSYDLAAWEKVPSALVTVVALTQGEYDALTPDPATLYVIS